MSNAPFMQISPHVYWFAPAPPDRPALGVVVGGTHTLLLDAGSSEAHTRELLAHLDEHGIAPPRFTALTHWHWDHTFGAAALSSVLIAQVETAHFLHRLAGYAWDDESLELRARLGFMATSVDDIKIELPEPRTVPIRQAEITFQDEITIHLGGGITCQIVHVGGDHSADSCVMWMMPDRVLFLGDTLYDSVYTPTRYYRAATLTALLDRLATFNATWIVEGHGDAVLTRAEYEALVAKMRAMIALSEQLGADAAEAHAANADLDEDSVYFLRALAAGARL